MELLAFIVILFVLVPMVRNWLMGKPNNPESLADESVGILAWIGRQLWTLVNGYEHKEDQYGSSRWATWRERNRVLKRQHKGAVVEGQNGKALSAEDTTRHILICGGSGSGKTERFCVYNLQNPHGSVVAFDPGGDLFKRTSGYLQSQGIHVVKWDLDDNTLTGSSTFNPLDYATSADNIDLIAHILIKSTTTEHGSQGFWNRGAELLLGVMIRIMKESSQCQGKCDLANLRYLINNMEGNGRKLIPIVAECSPDTRSEFAGVVNQAPETFLGVLSTAKAALSSFKGSSTLARLTRTTPNAINFDDLRQRKTVLFVCSREERQQFRSGVLNTLWTMLLQHLTQTTHAQREGHNVLLLLDEFASTDIPGFESTTIATARRKGVSIAMIIQSLGQLEKYGRSGMQTIWENSYTRTFLGSGIGDETAQRLEKILGRETVKVGGSSGHLTGKALMSASEIERLQYPYALFLQRGQYPAKIKMKYAYTDPVIQQRSNIPPARIFCDNRQPFQYIQIPELPREQQVELPP